MPLEHCESNGFCIARNEFLKAVEVGLGQVKAVTPPKSNEMTPWEFNKDQLAAPECELLYQAEVTPRDDYLSR